MARASQGADNSVYRIQIISGQAFPRLAKKIAAHIGVELANIELGEYSNGELNCRMGESVRGNDLYVIQTHAGNINSAIIEQLLIIDAAKRASANSITAVCPFLGYMRQDRKSTGREPIAARLLMDMLATAGADRIMSVDLHTGQIQGFFDGPFEHVVAMPILEDYIRKNFPANTVIVSPDAGRVKLNERYSRSLNREMVIIHKHRSKTARNQVEARELIGDVQGKTCLIIDDMIDTARTICAAADLLKVSGAKAVHGLATHGVLSGPAYDKINASVFKSLVVTDTLPIAKGRSNKIKVVSVAPLIAQAIIAASKGESVSAIFRGRNQI